LRTAAQAVFSPALCGAMSLAPNDVVIPLTPGACATRIVRNVRAPPTFLRTGDIVAHAEGADGSRAGIGLPKTPTGGSVSQVGSPRAKTAVMAPMSARRHSSPEVAAAAAAESQSRKVMRLKETFEKRADFTEEPNLKTPHMPWASTDTGSSQLKAWEEVQARVEAVIAERLEEWSRKLMDDQGGIQAKAQRALDLAEESNKACSKMAQQLEELGAVPFATVPQVDERIREKVEEMKNMWKVDAERSDELRGSLTSRTMPKTVAAVFDDLHGRLEEWVSAIEGRIYNIEQVIWSAVSFVDAATRSPGKRSSSSSSRVATSCGAMAGEIEVQPPLEAWNSETPVVHCLCVALRKLEGDVDMIRKSSDERSEEVHHMEAIFRSEIDNIQVSIKDLGNTHRTSCLAGSLPAKSAICLSETTENTDSSCQAEATNMQDAVQECTQRLGHVEVDMVHVKDEIKAQAVLLEVIQRDYQAAATGYEAKHKRHEAMTAREVKSKASNHGASVEVKAAQQPSVGASVEVRASHRKTPVARRVSSGAINTLRPATPAAPVSSNSAHEGTVSIRVAAAPDPTTAVQQQPQQGQYHRQAAAPDPQPSHQPQHHRQAAAALAPCTAWRWGMLASGAVPTASRQVSPSNSRTALPPQLQTERSALGMLKPSAFSKPASPTAALWPTSRAGPKAVARDRVSSPDLHLRA